MPNEQEHTAPLAPAGRLASLDVLRGFDMFWIMGGEGIVHALAKATGWSVFLVMSTQMQHVEWNGFRFYDMIFPLFLFLAGVSMPFSLAKRVERGDSKRELYLHITKRMLLLVFFGMMYNGFLKFDWPETRYPSVLGRIGLGWFFAALIFLNTGKKARWFWFAGILLAYWMIMTLIPVPGYGPGVLTVEGSLAGYIDRMLVPGRLHLGIHDPEGIISTIPSVATALMGVLAGTLLRSEDPRHTPLNKVLILAGAGVASVAAGYLWGLLFPVNKNLWTSSFVLVAGGFSLLLLSLFYLVVDVWKRRKWAFFFTVIGLNPITIYLAQSGIIDFGQASDYFFGGLIGYFSETGREVLREVGYVLMSWLFLYFLYRQRIFLKV